MKLANLPQPLNVIAEDLRRQLPGRVRCYKDRDITSGGFMARTRGCLVIRMVAFHDRVFGILLNLTKTGELRVIPVLTPLKVQHPHDRFEMASLEADIIELADPQALCHLAKALARHGIIYVPPPPTDDGRTGYEP